MLEDNSPSDINAPNVCNGQKEPAKLLIVKQPHSD